eukprot:GHVQ01003579.1.p1 GENE.GHVQ01003579.1~~GHVQ01003579.1.p1  ORF type:complete len:313 (+),score=28.06 GHVQ01003579.1:443-1381(+)
MSGAEQNQIQSSREPAGLTNGASIVEKFNPFMNAAVSCAIAGIMNEHGGPFGSCVVKNNKILVVTHNCVVSSGDPTAHAEMESIREACKLMRSHDLSDCELYATCDPCPMCWGAINWSGIRKVYTGVTREMAAKYGFDDALFYKELSLPHHDRYVSGSCGVKEGHVLEELFKKSLSYRRRLCGGRGTLATAYQQAFQSNGDRQWATPDVSSECHETFMQAAIDAANRGAKEGLSKSREPFGAVIVQNGKVVASACNTVLKDNDPTATAEINAIRKACSSLQMRVLEDCEMYTTAEPDIMSFGGTASTLVTHL